MTDRLTVETPDGAFSAFVAYPAVLPAPAVVLLHEVFGVNDDMRASCRELAAQGFIAIAPDLFWRQEPGLDLNHWSEEEWKKGLALYQAFNLDLGVKDVSATVDEAVGLPDCTGKVGVMGYCLGGLLTYLMVARKAPDAGVAYYPGSADQHLEEARRIQSPLLMHLGEEDEFISKPAQAAIRDALDGKTSVTIHAYPGQSHAFARHTGVHYDAASAALANERTYAFLHEHLD